MKSRECCNSIRWHASENHITYTCSYHEQVLISECPQAVSTSPAWQGTRAECVVAQDAAEVDKWTNVGGRVEIINELERQRMFHEEKFLSLLQNARAKFKTTIDFARCIWSGSQHLVPYFSMETSDETQWKFDPILRLYWARNNRVSSVVGSQKQVWDQIIWGMLKWL